LATARDYGSSVATSTKHPTKRTVVATPVRSRRDTEFGIPNFYHGRT
jgi:hypothetical protein